MVMAEWFVCVGEQRKLLALVYYLSTCYNFQIKELCRVVAKLSTDHRNLLHLVQIQPPSVRGIQLQRLLGVTLLHWLVPKFGQQQETGRRTDDERCDVAVPDNVEVKMKGVVKLII